MLPRQETSPPIDDPDRQKFCEYLRAQRESKGVSVEEIAHVTRIPSRSLRRLEAGRFEDLPGDVFVRGFLRSYARCVEMDPDDAIRRYASCGLEPAPVCSEEADLLRAQMNRAAGREPPPKRPEQERAEAAEPAAEESDASKERERSDEDAGEEKKSRRRRTFLPSELSAEGGESRRGQLTLAVIILVIVATLAMSYLMRQPTDAGEGVTDATSCGDCTPIA